MSDEFAGFTPDAAKVMDPTALALSEGVKTWNELVKLGGMDGLRRAIYVDLDPDQVRDALFASLCSFAQQSKNPDDYCDWCGR